MHQENINLCTDSSTSLIKVQRQN